MNINQDQVVEQTRESRREIAQYIYNNVRYGAEVAAALDKIIVTLSGGGLVFSMTFADRLAPARLWLPILFLSWFAFAMSIIGVTFSLRTLQNELSKKSNQLAQMSTEFEENLTESKIGSIITGITRHKRVAIWNHIGIWSFVSAILLLGVFVGRNLLASH